MNKVILGIFFVSLVILSLDSCYYDNGSELLINYNCDTSSFTYSNEVKPIMENFCVGCHNIANANGAVRVDTWEDLKLIADDGRLLGVINHEDGFLNMPADAPKLSPCNIKLIELWVADGALNN